MRILTKLALATALSSVMAFSASAEIINSDWLKEGDGLVSTDSISGIRFLKLTETANKSISEVQQELGSTYYGWRVSTKMEALTLLTNIVGNNSPFNPSIVGRQVFDNINTNLIDKDGVGWVGRTDNELYSTFSYGLALEDGVVTLTGFRLTNINYYNTQLGTYSALEGYDTLFKKDFFSVWLVRDADVPTPLALSGLALLGFGVVRRKRSN